jgi:hypothetical protein
LNRNVSWLTTPSRCCQLASSSCSSGVLFTQIWPAVWA